MFEVPKWVKNAGAIGSWTLWIGFVVYLLGWVVSPVFFFASTIIFIVSIVCNVSGGLWYQRDIKRMDREGY